VYSKGAEVIRMMHTLLGEQAFRAGMDEYFRRHDGEAVTCDDFVNAMEWALQQQDSKKTLSTFRRWYSQAGTPHVSVTLQHEPNTERCSVTLVQDCPPVGVEKSTPIDKQPFHIPITLGLLDSTGQPILLKTAISGKGETNVTLELTEASQTWVFDHVKTKPVPSLLRNFSAPVVIHYPYDDTELALLFAHDSNAFNRWEAGQEIATRKLLSLAQAWRESGAISALDPSFSKSWSAALCDLSIEAGYRARLLSLPPGDSVTARMECMDPLAVLEVRTALRNQLGATYATALLDTYNANLTPGPYSPSPGPAGKRALKGLALSFLMAAQNSDAKTLAWDQFTHATNMTDRMSAFQSLIFEGNRDISSAAITQFYEAWQHDPLVVDRWFSVVAASPRTTVDDIEGLMKHPAFTLKNPNRARSVIFAFCMSNTRGFHAADGRGYEFWSDQVLALDGMNPELAARLARTGDQWTRFIPEVRQRMRAQLERIAAHPSLSRNTLEIVSKALSL
jgi:aminopeptidase N